MDVLASLSIQESCKTEFDPSHLTVGKDSSQIVPPLRANYPRCRSQNDDRVVSVHLVDDILDDQCD